MDDCDLADCSYGRTRYRVCERFNLDQERYFKHAIVAEKTDVLCGLVVAAASVRKVSAMVEHTSNR